MKNSKLLCFIGATIIIIACFFGYQLYKKNVVTKTFIPLYNSLESLKSDQEKLMTAKRREIINESNRIEESARKLKLRIVEVNSTDPRSQKIKKAMMEAVEVQIKWSQFMANAIKTESDYLVLKEMLDTRTFINNFGRDIENAVKSNNQSKINDELRVAYFFGDQTGNMVSEFISLIGKNEENAKLMMPLSQDMDLKMTEVKKLLD